MSKRTPPQPSTSQPPTSQPPASQPSPSAQSSNQAQGTLHTKGKTGSKGSLAVNNFDRLFGTSQGSRNASGLMLIDRDHIDIAAQPRTYFDEQALADLTTSIQERRARGEGVEGTGILQPLLVAAVEGSNGRFRLIAGERRYRAAGSAGLQQVPAILVPFHESELLATQLIENLQRADLTVLEEARALSDLVSARGLSVREAAQVLGKDRGWVQNRLRLLKLGADVLEMVSFRNDSLPHAFEIDAVSDQALRKSLIEATRGGAPVAEIRRRIENHRAAGSLTGSSPRTLQQVSFQNDTSRAADGQNADGQNADGQNADGQNEGGQNEGGQNEGGQNSGGRPQGQAAHAVDTTTDTTTGASDIHPIRASLRSAASQVSHSLQLSSQLRLTAHQRREILQELAALQESIDVIRKTLRNT